MVHRRVHRPPCSILHPIDGIHLHDRLYVCSRVPLRSMEAQGIGFLVMYSLTVFFTYFGSNATTFVVLADIFPAKLRLTYHGISAASAASGKAGAIVGAFGFLYAAQSSDLEKTDAGYPPGIGVRNSMLMLGGVNFLVIVFSLLVPESKGKCLEELSRGDDEQISGGDATEMTTVPNSCRTIPV